MHYVVKVLLYTQAYSKNCYINGEIHYESVKNRRKNNEPPSRGRRFVYFSLEIQTGCLSVHLSLLSEDDDTCSHHEDYYEEDSNLR